MTKCDGCGEPIGHASTILAEYHDENLDKKDHYFGSTECQREFEKAHDVGEKVECHECGDLLPKHEMVKEVVSFEGIRLEQPFHEECAPSFSKQIYK